MTKLTQARWWIGDNPQWTWETVASSLLLCIGLAVVHVTGMPKDIGVLLFSMWIAHFVTAFVWARRLRKSQKEAQD